jgi:hypothetical protein
VLSREPWRYQLPSSPCSSGESGTGAHKLAVVPFDACLQAEVLIACEPTLRTPVDKPCGELERVESRKWSRNDRVLLNDERHEPDAKEEPDVSARPTGPNRHRHANLPMSSHERDSRRTLSNTTRTCNKLPDVYMCTRVAVMGMDRGLLARIDRKLLAGLGGDEAYRTVRVPAASAKWSTWRRYCESVGISMGRAVTLLIDRELIAVFGEHIGDDSPVFAQRATEQLAIREAKIAAREREVDAEQERMRGWGERLRRWEDELEVQERRAALVSKLASRDSPVRSKIGRNERCPCGSGRKFKHCHGLAGSRT